MATPDLLAKGVEAAVHGGATVIAVVSTAPFGSPALQHAVALANRHDALVIASPVTIRDQRGDVAYPAALPGVVSVMGIEPDGKPPGVRPANRPTLAAPGADLISIAPTGRGNVQGSGVTLGVGYAAGGAALVRAYLPRLPAAAVRDRLTATTDRSGGGPDPLLGDGIIDPVAAVTAVLPAATEHRPDPPTPQPVVLPHTPVVDHRPARAALAWAGAALLAGIGVATAGPILIHGRRRRWNASPQAFGPLNHD
jgi:membrane-anchored mycosin MYCP